MSHHVLLLGGHGKVAQLLTPLLLRRNWTVTSVIRDPQQKPAIEALRGSASGTLNVLIHSLEDVHGQADAQSVLDRVHPDYVVWSAGAGGKGGPSRTYAIDRDAAVAFVAAIEASPFVRRFVLVSYLAARRAAAPWWSASAWQDAQDVNQRLATYYDAKIVADEALYKTAQARGDSLAAIDLRPGLLTDGEPAGPVELGKTKEARGPTRRATVAAAIDALLAHPTARSAWLDLLDGEESLETAVDRVVKDKVDAVEGEKIAK